MVAESLSRPWEVLEKVHWHMVDNAYVRPWQDPLSPGLRMKARGYFMSLPILKSQLVFISVTRSFEVCRLGGQERKTSMI